MLVMLGLALAALVALVGAYRWSFLRAQPDEWLIQVRGGRLIDAGIGIAAWRLPGDVAARFSSTVQRVTFSAEMLTREHCPVTVEGFALWSVGADGEQPFVAFRKLGIANLDRPPPDLRSRKHLLTSAQYRAFQSLLAAETQALGATLTLEMLLGEPGALLAALGERLRAFGDGMGIVIERVEILRVRPLDASLVEDLAAHTEQRVRAEAARVRLETSEQLHTREQQLARAQQLGAEAVALELARARQQRDELELAARLDRVRREAQAERDAALERAAAGEQKSQALRDDELARFTAEKVAQVLAALPLKDARWVSIGGESPVASLAGVVAGVRELLALHTGLS